MWAKSFCAAAAAGETGCKRKLSVYAIRSSRLAIVSIYGPAFELLEHVPREAGSEEYLDSEKYQVRTWHTDPQKSIAPVIAQMNRIRSARPALRNNRSLRFHLVNNERLIAYSKSAPLEDGTTERILVVVNLDSEHRHSGFVELPLFDWGIDPEETFQVHDLLSGARYFWRGWRNYVELDPGQIPAHIFIVKPNVRSVHDFEYFV